MVKKIANMTTESEASKSMRTIAKKQAESKATESKATESKTTKSKTPRAKKPAEPVFMYSIYSNFMSMKHMVNARNAKEALIIALNYNNIKHNDITEVTYKDDYNVTINDTQSVANGVDTMHFFKVDMPYKHYSVASRDWGWVNVQADCAESAVELVLKSKNIDYWGVIPVVKGDGANIVVMDMETEKHSFYYMELKNETA